MIKDSVENGYLFLAAGIICIFAVIMRFLLSVCYGHWVKASNFMDRDNIKSLERLKNRFETMHKMNMGVKNVDIFVDKYLNSMKICGLYLSTWENISGQARALCTILGISTGIIGIYYECGQMMMLSTIGMCAGGIALTLFVDNLSSVAVKKGRLKINITDYLENYLIVRLELPKHLEGYAASTLEDVYDIINDGSYKTYLKHKLDKAEKKYIAEKIKLEKKIQEKKRKKEKKELFAKAKREQKNEIRDIRMKEEQEALAEMRKKRAQKQKERKERIIEEMNQRNAVETNIEENTLKDISEAATAIEEGSKDMKRILTAEEGRLIEEVLKEFLV